MSAFQGDERVKKSYLAAVEAMEAARREGGEGDSDLRLRTLPAELGIPQAVLALAEALAEGLSPLQRLAWARRFISAVSAGAELDRIWMQWLLWSLRSPDCGLLPLNLDTLAHPTLELLERYFQRRLAGGHAGANEAARIEGIVMLMEQDSANWLAAKPYDYGEAAIARAARAIWDARDGEAACLALAASAAADCRRGARDFSALRAEAFLDLLAHAPVTAAF